MIVLELADVDNEHCKKRVTDGLKEVNGVKSVHVDLKESVAHVDADDTVTIDILEKKLNDIGYHLKGRETVPPPPMISMSTIQVEKTAASPDIQTIDLPFIDVNSEHCSIIVHNGLSKLDGIKKADINYANQRGKITYDPSKISINDIIVNIRDMGYGVNTLKVTLPVVGMSCTSCANKVETSIKKLKGVIQANINFAASNIFVEYIPSVVSIRDMQKAVHDVGYELLGDADTEKELLEEIKKTRYADLQRKVAIAGVLAVIELIIATWFPMMPYANWIMFILSIPVLFWSGLEFFVNAYKQAKHYSSNMDTLVALGTGAAFVYSAFNTVFPSYLKNQGIEPHVYFEIAAIIIALILLGRMLEEGAKTKTSAAIKKLLGLQAKSARVIRDGKEVEISINEVVIGDIVIIKPGEKIPVDGTVSEGESYIDESMITGEPIPAHKKPGNKVIGGTINKTGSFHFTAEKIGAETMLSQIIRMVQEAQGSKAPIQKLVDQVSSIFVPAVIGIALLSFAVWFLFGPDPKITYSIIAAVTVLIIACPCALGLATPTSIMVGVGRAALNGILIKDAESLELAHKVNAIMLDKTGTITKGEPEVTDIIWADGVSDKQKLSQIIYSVESKSEHPLASAVVKKLSPDKLPYVTLDRFESITGHGVKAAFEGKDYCIGNKKLIDENNIKISSKLISDADRLSGEAKTVVYVAQGNEVVAIIAIADQIKESSKKAIAELQGMGIEVYMLTGDNEKTAQVIASQVGIKNYFAQVLPADKLNYIKKLQDEGKKVAMVGDGINDAPALAQANVGIAMGTGTDVAIESAKITLVKGDLEHIVMAIKLSKATVRNIRQNLFWAFIYNVLGIPVAAGVLYPFFGFLLNPIIAGGAMAFSSVSVVTNSLRLNRIKL